MAPPPNWRRWEHELKQEEGHRTEPVTVVAAPPEEPGSPVLWINILWLFVAVVLFGCATAYHQDWKDSQAQVVALKMKAKPQRHEFQITASGGWALTAFGSTSTTAPVENTTSWTIDKAAGDLTVMVSGPGAVECKIIVDGAVAQDQQGSQATVCHWSE